MFVPLLASAATVRAQGASAPRPEAIELRSGSELVGVIPVRADASQVPPNLGGDGTPPPGADGTTWVKMVCPAGIYLRAISMASPQVGYAAGELGVVLRTVDGGNTWQYVLNQGFPYYYYGVQAFGEDTAVVSGFQNQTGEGVLRWTDDGGASWDPVVVVPAPTFLDWLYFIRFVDASRGVVQAWGGGVHYTTTGGRTAADWSFRQPTQNWWLGTFTFLKDGRVWMTGYDNFRSLDGGATWAPIPDADPLFDGPNSILANGLGYIGGGTISPSVAGWVYATADGGNSWTPSPVLLLPYPARAILRLNSQRAWVVGGNYFSGVGGIWGTEDGGTTWTLEQTTGAELVDITAVRISAAEIHVYAVGMVSQIWRATVSIPAGRGDLNCDDALNVFDIDPFVLALTDPAGYATAYPHCDWMLADCNGDGAVNAFDIDPFVALLVGP